MPRIDLITGFLGSGKTTFIKKYARHLMDQGKRIGILENDYGAINVDMMLLGDLPSDQCDLEMVAGGCDYDCHRRRFRTKLIAMGMSGYDVVIVEPSGIYDVDEFFDVLSDEPLDQWYTIGSVLSIVDATLDPELSEDSDYLLATQTVNAGKIILSRSQEASPEQIDNTFTHLQRVMAVHRTLRDKDLSKDDVLTKNWDDYSKEDWDAVLSAGYIRGDHVKKMVDRENAYASLFYMHAQLTEDSLLDKVHLLFDHPERFGNVIRVKGFIKNSDNPSSSPDSQVGWTEINATRNSIHSDPIQAGQEVIIVIGENLNKDEVDQLFPGAVTV